MSLASGTRLGPYEIVVPIGAGGMGEVYRAKDTRLDRTVAIKVLPAHLSSDVELRARFEREARVVSGLNHPHICTLHDIGHQDGVDYLVMEYLEGETVAEKIAKGPLPLEQTLRTATQIADALDRAHRAGVVHRDLKPGNVILTRSGAKLLDFGLAKSRPPVSSPGLSTLATEAAAKPLTERGTVLGTVQYMAPEQLEGKDADARSDVFAFGTLLYEMVTRKRAFSGSSQASLISAILRDEPAPIASLQPLTPPALDRVVKTCLAKDPDERWQSAHDLGKELRWIADGSSTGGVEARAVTSRAARSTWLPWAVATLATIAAVALGTVVLRRAAPQARAIKASILLPANVRLATSSIASSPLALSPDGTRLALCLHSGAGADQLWVQVLDSGEARALAGTEGATQPFWSPDGRSIGFFAERKLKRVDAQGGPVLALADAIDPRGGAWGAGGVILFSPDYRSSLYRIAADGGSGKPVPVTTLDTAVGETTNRYPSFLPDGNHFLFLARRALVGRGSEPSIVAASLGSPARKALVSVASNAAYASGHLLFMREGILVAQPFDPEKLVTRGDAVPIASDARADERFSRGTFSVSTNGVLAYQLGKATRKCEIRRYDRSGRFEVLGEPATLYEGSGAISLSPDGSRAAAAILSEKGNAELWLVNTSTGQRSRFTLDAADHSDSAWTRDGSRLALAGSVGPVGKLVLKATDGSGAVEELLTGDQSLEADSVSPDGKTVLVTEYSAKTGYDLFTLSVSGDRTLRPFVATAAQENLAQFSPNGRFVAYESDATGLLEIYVAAFPQPGDTWQVSQKGAHSPRWSKDGTELFFIDRDNWLQAASVDTSGTRFEVKSIQPLFQEHDPSFFSWNYDVFPDGKHFLVGSPSEDDALSPIALVTEWDRKLRSP